MQKWKYNFIDTCSLVLSIEVSIATSTVADSQLLMHRQRSQILKY